MDTSDIILSDLPSVCRMMASETPKSHAAFCVYLTQYPKRELQQVARVIGVNVDRVYAWSSEYNWRDRTKVYDDWLSEQLLKQHAKSEVQAMLTRHADQARAFLNISGQFMNEFFRRVKEDADVLKGIPIAELVDTINRVARVIPAMQEAEAVARGLTPAKRVEVTGANGSPVGIRFMPPVVVHPNSRETNAAQITASNNDSQ